MRKSFYAIGMLCGVLHAAANAETITWQGGDVENPGSWSAAANWDLNRLPQSADDIVIANGDNVTLDVADDFTLEGELRVAGNSRLTQSAYKYMHWNKITLDGGVYVASEAYALDLRGQTTIANCGGLIFAGKAITIVAGNSITVAGGRLEAQEIAVEGSLSVDGGTVAAARIGLNGTMSISGGEVALDGGMITRGATSRLELAGGAITLANQNFLLRPDDVYTGGTVRGINEMHQIDADSNFEVELDGTEFYCALISSSSVMKYKFRSGALIASNTSYSGMYSGNGARIAIPTDSTARWTFAGSNAAYSYFQGRAIYADDEDTITEEEFSAHFTYGDTTLEDGSPAVEIRHVPQTGWELANVDVAANGGGATLSTAVTQSAGAYDVYFAFSKDEPVTEDSVVAAGEVVAGSGEAYSKILSGLEENCTYHYGFAVVADGAVQAFRSGTFFTSDYSYIYASGAWQGATPASGNGEGESMLFADSYNWAGELHVDGKVARGATLTATTFLQAADADAQAMSVVDAQVASMRNSDNTAVMDQVPYGLYAFGGNNKFFDFVHTAVAANTVYPACSYTCYMKDGQVDGIESALLASGKITVGGAIPSIDMFEIVDTGVLRSVEDTVYKAVKITLFDTIPTSASGTWTLRENAYAKLAGDTMIRGLSIGAGATLDLAGHTLTLPEGTLANNGTIKENGGSIEYVAADAGATLAADDFEAANNWSAGVRIAAEVAQPATGWPIASATHENVLEVAGEAERTIANAEAGADAEVDMLVKVVRAGAEEAPADEVKDGDEQPQIALTFDAAGHAQIYCHDETRGGAFATVGGTAYADGEWVRVTMVFDYVNRSCQVMINGKPLASAAGYATQALETPFGAWYKLANQHKDKISSLVVKGSSQIDDVVVKNQAIDAYNPYKDASGRSVIYSASAGVDIPVTYLVENDISEDQLELRSETSGLTAAQAYVAGIDWNGTEKFIIKSGEFNGGKFRLTFPGTWDAATYTVSISTIPGDVGEAAETTKISGGRGERENVVDVTLPDAPTVYFKVSR